MRRLVSAAFSDGSLGLSRRVGLGRMDGPASLLPDARHRHVDGLRAGAGPSAIRQVGKHLSNSSSRSSLGDRRSARWPARLVRGQHVHGRSSPVDDGAHSRVSLATSRVVRCSPISAAQEHGSRACRMTAAELVAHAELRHLRRASVVARRCLAGAVVVSPKISFSERCRSMNRDLSSNAVLPGVAISVGRPIV